MELIPEFIKRRHGEVKIEYEHPLLEPICSETYGIMVYQEQVMQAAQVLAGYTLGGADLLRRAMGKKKVEEMQKQRESFVKGCAKTNQIPAPKANQIFGLLEKFAGYGFNKSHAAAYAIVAYQTAYLKANYPVEFLSAMMTNDMGDTKKLGEFINEARVMGIEVLPPDVNESQVVFAPARGGQVIRFGMAAIKGVGEIAVESILSARKTGGPSTARRWKRSSNRARAMPSRKPAPRSFPRLTARCSAPPASFRTVSAAKVPCSICWRKKRRRNRRRSPACRNGRSMNCWRTKKNCSVFMSPAIR
jgi:DNA polymerase-3 subunit alpha